VEEGRVVIALVFAVGWIIFAVLALALVSGARHTAPKSEPIPPILRITTRSELDGGAR
jgi:hypothetical protein